MPKQPIIHVKNLSKTYTFHKKAEGLSGSVKALFRREKLYKNAVKDVSFDIKPGEIIGFIGPNGAGKTTTLKMLSGILTPTEGTVRVAGHTPIEREDEFKKKISIVMGQKSQLWTTLPAIETYGLIQRIYEIPEPIYRKRLNEFSKLMNVEDLLHVQVRKLSLGQRMKCELIASLLHNPKVIFLDEPTIGLDVLSQKKIRQFLLEHNKREKATIILTSHNMDDVEDLCKRLIIINEGEIGYDGSLRHIIEEYSKFKYVGVKFSERVEKDQLRKLGHLTHYRTYESEIRVPSRFAMTRISEIIRKFPVHDINIRDVTLEEIVSDIFSKHSR